uniref:Uncharacterized protein n=1 Tax=Strigamia maritima TaxID=126957 RepID=T1JLI0_STRMM
MIADPRNEGRGFHFLVKKWDNDVFRHLWLILGSFEIKFNFEKSIENDPSELKENSSAGGTFVFLLFLKENLNIQSALKELYSYRDSSFQLMCIRHVLVSWVVGLKCPDDVAYFIVFSQLDILFKYSYQNIIDELQLLYSSIITLLLSYLVFNVLTAQLLMRIMQKLSCVKNINPGLQDWKDEKKNLYRLIWQEMWKGQLTEVDILRI